MLSCERSKALFSQAKTLIPGGVNSPVRAFSAVGGEPLFIRKAKGAYLWDVDNNRYIDYVGSWGPAILGHAHDEIIAKLCEAAQAGLSFGAPTESESLLAEEIHKALPSMEKLRLVSSGTEACMAAIRLARGFTGRDKIIMFEGSYHGHGDMLLAKAGSGAATFSLPQSAGVPKGVIQDTLVAPYNDLEKVRELFSRHPHSIACIIVEPIVGNAGFIRPLPGFLQGLRELCSANGALLIFDEVMTGFRLTYGGMQTLSGIGPDLTTLGKVIGGGMPLAAFGGRTEIMDKLAPLGPVYQAGTLSGHPLAAICGLHTLRLLAKQPQAYLELHQRSQELVQGIVAAAKAVDLPLSGDSEGGMFGLFFHAGPIHNFADAKNCQTKLFARYFHAMLAQGIYWPPSAFEAGFMSLAHKHKDIQATIAAAKTAFCQLATEFPSTAALPSSAPLPVRTELAT